MRDWHNPVPNRHPICVSMIVPERPLMTVPQAAERLNVSEKTVRRLIEAEILPALRVGGSIRVEADELNGWLGERRTNSAVGDSSVQAVGRSSVDTPAERDGTSRSREAVEPAQLAGDER